jgi:integrase/recombinase XerD
MRFLEAVEGFWLDRRRELSPNTQSDYARTFRRFAGFVRNAELGKVTPRQVNQFLEWLVEEFDMAPKTVLNAWIALSAFWTWAEGADEVKAKHIIRQVPRPNAHSLPMDPFSEDEMRRLLAAVKVMRAYSRRTESYVDGKRPTAARDAAIILVLLDTGLRVSELCNLQVRHLDRVTGRLLVEKGKGSKARVVYLGQAAQRSVWRWMVSRGEVKQTDWMFGSSRGKKGGKMRRESVRMMIVRTGQRAGVAGATCHRFRHTFAINFLRNGGHIAALQDVLGHSSLEMVRRYARLAEVDIADAQRGASPADRWGL